MSSLQGLSPARVFAIFEEICAVPRSSGNRRGIADHVQAFANTHGLRCVHDEAHNVVIYKNGSAGRENEPPVILQGHLDMVCQKTADCTIDFDKDGIEPYVDGDMLRARGTTLGADNGIAAAMIMAVLENRELSHPPIEAVFTADEEIGMLGAAQLDMGLLKGRRMINLDAEEDDTLTVSCAGGCDVCAVVKLTREEHAGTLVSVTVSGLLGGHSGVEIHKHRTNADKLMGRLLMHAVGGDVRLIAVSGGDKANAIPNACTAELCVGDPTAFTADVNAWLEREQEVLAAKEPSFAYELTVGQSGTHTPMTSSDAARVIALLCVTPDGVVQMSDEIEGLVETSLNLGILKTDGDTVTMHFALRSNKAAGLALLENALLGAMKHTADKTESFGHYPPWEFKADSPLQQTFIDAYTKQYGHAPKVEAIHAGLECAVFASRLAGLDCIACGPTMWDVHTTNERLSISSAQRTYELLVTILETL